MQIKYSAHARGRMAERDVTELDVRECLSTYVQRITTRKRNEYKSVVHGRMLKVFVAPDRDTESEKFIVTVAWEDDDGI